jgi:calmodulin
MVLLYNMDVITEEQIANFKEAFAFFDKDGDNVIETRELPMLVRSLYQNPSEVELKEWGQEVDPEQTGRLDFPEFLSLMARKYKELESEEELLDIMSDLKTMAEGSRLVNAREFRVMMVSLGDTERLTEAEIDELYEDLKIDASGHFNCEDFIQLILQH